MALSLFPAFHLFLSLLSSGFAADSHREGWFHRQGGGWNGRGRLRVLPWWEIRPGLQIPPRSWQTHLWRGAGWHLPRLCQQLPRWAIFVVFVDLQPEMKYLYSFFTSLPSFSVVSIEDPFDQDDWEAWSRLTAQVGIQVVGDDLTVTNPKRIEKAAEERACNCLLLKVNQIGSVTEAIQAYVCFISVLTRLFRSFKYCAGLLKKRLYWIDHQVKNIAARSAFVISLFFCGCSFPNAMASSSDNAPSAAAGFLQISILDMLIYNNLFHRWPTPI